MSRIAPVLASARQRLLAVRRTGARPPRICGRPPISPCAGQKELSIPPVVPIQERAALRSVGAHSSGAPACEVRGTSRSPGHLGPRRILGHPPARPPPARGRAPSARSLARERRRTPQGTDRRPAAKSRFRVRADDWHLRCTPRDPPGDFGGDATGPGTRRRSACVESTAPRPARAPAAATDTAAAVREVWNAGPGRRRGGSLTGAESWRG